MFKRTSLPYIMRHKRSHFSEKLYSDEIENGNGSREAKHSFS